MTAPMNSRYDIYALPSGPLVELAARLQELLGLPLDERDSGYYAGTYYLYKQAYGRELRLYENHDRTRGTVVRERWREHALILEVSDLDDMDGIRRKLMDGLPGTLLLSSRIVPDAKETS
jgi:hypothetical protein